MDIHIDSQQLSRSHAAIVHHTDGTIYVIDLQSVSFYSTSLCFPACAQPRGNRQGKQAQSVLRTWTNGRHSSGERTGLGGGVGGRTLPVLLCWKHRPVCRARALVDLGLKNSTLEYWHMNVGASVQSQGTFLDGRPLQVHKPTKLLGGQVLQLGETDVKFSIKSSGAARTTAPKSAAPSHHPGAQVATLFVTQVA